MRDTTFLDWPFFDNGHRQLARQLENWASETLGDFDHADIDATCRCLVMTLGRAGWLAHAAPDPKRPAARLQARNLALIRETLARHSGLADFAFAMQALGAGPISLFGSPEQRRAYLSRVRRGTAIAAFALTEPASGSDVANITMRAVRTADGYILDGEKTWISNGGIADFCTVFARTGGPGAKGLSAFIVPASTPGLHVAERLQVIAPHPLARLVFDGCKIPLEARIGEEGQGFAIAMSVLDVLRPTVGAAALGFARKALHAAVERATTRQLYGARLADMQMVQGHIADMAVSVDAAALLIYRAAWAKDQGAARISREAAMAKLFATETAQKVIDSALQIHGGQGVQAGSVTEELYREIRALRIYEGASDVQRIIIARATLEALGLSRKIAPSGGD